MRGLSTAWGRLIAITVLVGVLVPMSAASAVPASLHHPVVRTDPNDTKSPLDLRWMKLTHLGPRADRLWFTTWGPVTNTELDPVHHGNFAIGIDLNNEFRRSGYEYVIYVDALRGPVRGVVFNVHTHHLSRTSAARVNAHEFRVDIPLGAIGHPTSYRFAAISFYKAAPCSTKHPCLDGMPNRTPLAIQDLTPPTVRWITSSAYSSDLSATLSYPAKFTIADDKLGSGVRRWQVQRQAVGTTAWTNVAAGSAHAPTVGVPGQQGMAYHLRIVTSDRQGNTSIGARKTIIFPFDDQNSAVTYTGTWNAATGSLTSFLGTTSSSSTIDDTASFAFTGGHQVCVLGMSVVSDAAASATLDGSGVDPLAESNTTQNRGRIDCYAVTGSPSTTHTLVLTIAAGTDAFIIDGFAVAP